MSILIKGLEMPTNCGACPLRLAWCRERLYMVTRPKRCPLVEVTTPHGRLIDEVFISQVEWYTEDGRYIANAGEFETDAPTIIEAEEGEAHD